jgi:hypothetical protein
MRYVLIVLGVIVGLIVLAFAALLINLQLASARQRKRIAQLLEPVTGPLRSGAELPVAAVRQLASNPQTRNHLYQALEGAGKQHLFPAEFRTPERFAESDMASWLAHPNELGAAPDEIKLVKVASVPTSEAGNVQWYLFRFRTNPPHWAAKNGWMAGASGPYPKSPGAGLKTPRGTFSELHAFEAKSPDEHVKQLHDHAVLIGALKDLKKQAT